jgi:hypothetical protein
MELQKMQFCSVTFVLAEAILRELRAKVTHDPVPRDLGDHACRRNAQADAIAIDNCCLRHWKRDNRQTIDQDVIGRFEQRFDREAHRTVARTQNIDPVDLDGIDNADRPPDFGIRSKFAIDFLSQFRRELFGIVQTTMPKLFGENCSSSNDRPGQGTATSFVNPRNPRDPRDAEFFLVTKSTAPIGHRQKLSADCADFHRFF